MKHLAQIQTEFLKAARSWDDLTIDEQHAYLKRHPGSKRKLTGKSLSAPTHAHKGIKWSDLKKIKPGEIKQFSLNDMSPSIVQDIAHKLHEKGYHTYISSGTMAVEAPDRRKKVLKDKRK
jgi:hypothetical protein